MTFKYLRMTDLDLTNKRVIIREDLNVPLQNGIISDDNRILQALPTLKLARDKGARILILSHLGQPQKAEFDAKYSLAPVAKALSQMLGQTVKLVDNWLDGIEIEQGEIVLAENVRFIPGEVENSTELGKKMADQCDIFVMDAFASAHRSQASTTGISHWAKQACAGPLLTAELEALSTALDNPEHPVVAIVGGSKVSSKIHLLHSLLTKVDTLIVGGGMANTLLAAHGKPIGKSLYEENWQLESIQLTKEAHTKGINLPLPVDVVVAQEFSKNASAQIKNIDDVTQDDMILDIGPNTIKHYLAFIKTAKTIIWNGPAGVFEFPAFSQGTQAIAQAIACSDAYSLAGGGDTVAAINQFGIKKNISYISTGGGAFLEFIEGKTLPAIATLIDKLDKQKSSITVKN